MKIKFLLVLLSCTLLGISQQLLDNPINGLAVPEKCKTMHAHEELLNSDPQYVLKRQAEELQYQQFLQNPDLRRVTYTIPVVVHVIHLGTAVGTGANITDAQIQSAIDNLNDAYSNTSTAHSTYTGVNTNIQFCLAQRDPSGNPTTGINRVNGSGTSTYATYGLTDGTEASISNDDNETTIKALSKWDNTKYYNIWVVTEINNNGGGAGTQGFAYFPGAGASVDGTIILYNSFGYDPDGSLGYNLKSYTNRNVTTIHEVGHALNLYHTFQGDGTGSTCPTDAVCGTSGDCVSDTPPHKRSNSDCLINTNDATCGNVDRDLYVHNFMDYSSDACQTEFTAGQSTRMQAVLQGGGGRVSLMTSDGCNPVYTDEASMYAIVTPTSNECGNSVVPVVTIKNTGSATLTSLTITYSMNGGTNQVYNWTGSLAQSATENVTLASMTTSAGSNTFLATLSLPNGAADQNSSNDSQSITFNASGSVPASTCTIATDPTHLGNYNTGISRVQFNTIDNSHDDNANDGTQDFTCEHYTNVNYGSSYTLTITTESSGGKCKAYIDYNDDGLYTADELVLNNTTSATSHSTTVNIPSEPSITAKIIRLRIILDPNTIVDGCTSPISYGEVEDYGVIISTPPCTNVAITTHPSDVDACAGSNASFTVAATGPSRSYQWKVSTDGGNNYSNISNGGIYSGATSTTLNLTNIALSDIGNMYQCYVSNSCSNETSNAATLTNNSNTLPFSENFEGSFPPTNWSIFSDDANTAWGAGGTKQFAKRSVTVQSSGTSGNAAAVEHYNYNVTGKIDELISPKISLNGSAVPTLTFDVSYKHYSPTDIEKLRVLISTDCGTSYTEVFMKEGADLAIDGTSTSSEWAPTSIAHWRNESIDLSAYIGSDVTIKFETTNDYGNNLYIDNVNVTDVGLTKLETASCGKTLTSMNEALYSDAVVGATNYRYWVQHAASGYSVVSTRGANDNLFRLSWLSANPAKYGTTYTIKVAAYVSGAWRPYGSSCNVTTPLTKLDAVSCGKSLTTMDEQLTSYSVAGATKYRYEIRKKSDNSFVGVTDRNANENFIRLSWLTSNPAQYNTTYTIRVAAFVNSSWQAYGAACDVNTPTTVKLTSTYCNQNIPSMSTALYSEVVAGATNYRFEIRKQSDNSLVGITDRSSSENFIRLSWLTANPAQYNTPYKIRVAAYIGGSWTAYGETCTVTTPVSGMMVNEEQESYDIAFDLEDLFVETYPNPNTGEFTVSSSHEGTFHIINELGQVIQVVSITKENNFEVKVSDMKYGIYFITGTINNEVITKKVVVRN